MSHPASQPEALTLPQSRLHVVGASSRRFVAKSVPGKLPSTAELHAGNVENIRPLSREESQALFRSIERMVGGARSDLAAAKQVRT